MRILLVSQMYPSAERPAFGVFVSELERELATRGHLIERAVVDDRGDNLRHPRLLRAVIDRARGFAPDVVYAHFLVPAGLVALAARAPLVVTAHGQDVENALSNRVVRAATRHVVRQAAAVIAVSGWLAERLLEAVPDAQGKLDVIDCGVDISRFGTIDRDQARLDVGWPPSRSSAASGSSASPAFLCVGALTARKNVLRLARAFEQLGEGSLAFVGDGPLRPALEGRPGITVAGERPHDEIPVWLAACDVLCQPSLKEPFGVAALEALAASRNVIATTVGGPREFVPATAGTLVDPSDDDELLRALKSVSELPVPNPAARAAAEKHDLRLKVSQIEEILARSARDRQA